jgi:hypothetical protein
MIDHIGDANEMIREQHSMSDNPRIYRVVQYGREDGRGVTCRVYDDGTCEFWAAVTIVVGVNGSAVPHTEWFRIEGAQTPAEAFELVEAQAKAFGPTARRIVEERMRQAQNKLVIARG